jgi:hypothetical protein
MGTLFTGTRNPIYRYDPKTDTWYPDKTNNPNKPKPNYPKPLGPPDGYPPNPNAGSVPWWCPANPDDDWKYNTGMVVGGSVVIGGGLAVAAPGAVGAIGGGALKIIFVAPKPVLVP